MLLLVLALGACDDDRAPRFSAARAHHDLAEVYAGDHPSARDLSDADCFADHLLGTAGAARLVRAGVLAPDGSSARDLHQLDRTTAGLWADAELACVDFRRSLARAASSVGHHGVTADEAYRCLQQSLSDTQLRDSIAAALMGRMDDPAVTRLSQAQSRCARS